MLPRHPAAGHGQCHSFPPQAQAALGFLRGRTYTAQDSRRCLGRPSRRPVLHWRQRLVVSGVSGSAGRPCGWARRLPRRSVPEGCCCRGCCCWCRFLGGLLAGGGMEVPGAAMGPSFGSKPAIHRAGYQQAWVMPRSVHPPAGSLSRFDSRRRTSIARSRARVVADEQNARKRKHRHPNSTLKMLVPRAVSPEARAAKSHIRLSRKDMNPGRCNFAKIGS